MPGLNSGRLDDACLRVCWYTASCQAPVKLPSTLRFDLDRVSDTKGTHSDQVLADLDMRRHISEVNYPHRSFFHSHHPNSKVSGQKFMRVEQVSFFQGISLSVSRVFPIPFSGPLLYLNDGFSSQMGGFVGD